MLFEHACLPKGLFVNHYLSIALYYADPPRGIERVFGDSEWPDIFLSLLSGRCSLLLSQSKNQYLSMMRSPFQYNNHLPNPLNVNLLSALTLLILLSAVLTDLTVISITTTGLHTCQGLGKHAEWKWEGSFQRACWAWLLRYFKLSLICRLN